MLDTPELTWRRFGVLALQLARMDDSQTAAAAAGGWSWSKHRLADLVDITNLHLWVAGSGENSDQPKPLPRPGDGQGERRLARKLMERKARKT